MVLGDLVNFQIGCHVSVLGQPQTAILLPMASAVAGTTGAYHHAPSLAYWS
jgi:hypothetical protein